MAPPAVIPETLDMHDIQGMLLRGYGDLREARFRLLKVIDADRARAYLQDLSGRLNIANDSPETCALQVAFTAAGLRELGVPARVLETFSREFLEGMDDDIRAEALGDRLGSEPSKLVWGKRDEPIHVLLMVYAKEGLLNAQLAVEEKKYAGGLEKVHDKETIMLDEDREHFGWRDGLSMPKIEGVVYDGPEHPRKKHQESWTHALPAGEFLLGYRNDYKHYTPSPRVEPADDRANHLLVDPIDKSKKSLGRNGTYLVYREMTQEVHGFWRYLLENSREPGVDAAARAIALGAKMVGRWPDGAPLVTSPDADNKDRATDNEFLYATTIKDAAGNEVNDLVGLRCPAGSHIRRSNPRDALAVHDRSTDASRQMVRKHQMVRRGRAFGPPVDDKLDPRKMLAVCHTPDNVTRGLHFMCLVGDIARQFEFVQRAWIHSANFESMYKDGDPVSAARRPAGQEPPTNEFTCPAVPVRRKYKAIPQFAHLVGGAYFFLPGIRALRFISRHP